MSKFAKRNFRHSFESSTGEIVIHKLFIEVEYFSMFSFSVFFSLFHFRELWCLWQAARKLTTHRPSSLSHQCWWWTHIARWINKFISVSTSNVKRASNFVDVVSCLLLDTAKKQQTSNDDDDDVVDCKQASSIRCLSSVHDYTLRKKFIGTCREFINSLIC